MAAARSVYGSPRVRFSLSMATSRSGIGTDLAAKSPPDFYLRVFGLAVTIVEELLYLADLPVQRIEGREPRAQVPVVSACSVAASVAGWDKTPLAGYGFPAKATPRVVGGALCPSPSR